jgi:RNA polymerase sigma-70 factor, ECF subfamily
VERAIDAASAEFIARLRAFARGRVRTDQDAEDIVQDVLAKLVQREGSVNARSAQAWLFTVTRRAIIDRARARPGDGPLPEELPPAPDIAQEPSAVADLARCLEPMLAELDAEDRALLLRVDMMGESQADVAREIGLSASGLKSRVQRARRRLRQVVDECCAVEYDRRGMPIDFARRRGGPCACDRPDGAPCEP